MKKQLLVLTVLLATATWSYGQITRNESKLSRGYLRLGFSNFGQELNDDLSNFSVDDGGLASDATMLENLLDGRYGAKRGYVFEFGRNYYFNKNSLLPIFDTKIGLDWTQLSLTYNELDWSSIIERDRAAGYEVDEMGFFAASASSKIGPVISINFIDKLVLDVRAQLAATYFVNGLDYYAYSEDDERYFTFMPEEEDSEEVDGIAAFGKLGKFGFKQNYGATVRYSVIGLSIDYFPGSFKYAYETSEGGGDVQAGEEKFKNNVFQIKLSLTL
ncbi:hypothetical protein [Parapedobacter sp. 10938]|uniref:hypothetical protein n=1 Tax=Parapedobacter flavus TaxID=3110225 RepID=UPI002DB6DDEE|nr:hypothetical protein [Parapedobacter sp. 10938]MEC3878820.1 hypothetical protein [Parapedobacter sp. 10938]